MGGERLDYVVTVVAQVGLVLVAAALVVVSPLAWWLWRGLRRVPATAVPRTEAGQPTLTGMSGPALRAMPLVRFTWTWEQPTHHPVTLNPMAGRLIEQVTPEGRGYHEQATRRFVVEDVLGLVRLAFCLTDRWSAPFQVVPHFGGLRQSAVVSTLAGGDELPHPLGTLEGDRLELRRYAHGDPARLIVWKIFGRTRRLVVRTPERALARAHAVAAYLVTGPDDEAAAATARLAVEMGALGSQWVMGADGAARDVHHEDEALELIARSANAGEENEGAGLADFMARQEKQGTVRFLLFAPAAGGEWVDRVSALASRRPGRVDVIMAGDGIGRSPSSLWRGMFWQQPAKAVVDGDAVESRARRLVARGVAVAVVDRPTGHVVSDAQLRRARMVA
jgi:uncharacterized protein (DUF58 family)